LERPIVNFANAFGYRAVPIDLGLTVFLPPAQNPLSIANLTGKRVAYGDSN
jgi:hypothetical protein